MDDEDVKQTAFSEKRSNTSEKADEVEATGFPELLPQPSPTIVNIQSQEGEASREISEDLEKYNMRHRRRGMALIFNHEYFDNPQLKRREGAVKDQEALKDTLDTLGFDTRFFKDLDVSSVMKNLHDVSRDDHSDADCLLVAVMTHGEDGGYIHARDRDYKTEHVWTLFTADRVPSLAGKPKIFFFQACRGRNLEDSVLVTDSTDSSTNTSKKIFAVPTHADFFIGHSTMEGESTDEQGIVGEIATDKAPRFFSWRNPHEGSWFIQDLCKELKTNARRRDFMTLLTFVLRRVAYDRFSNVPNRPTMHSKKQMPVITSTLTRLLYLDETSL